MKKNDLITGKHVVEIRDGDMYIVLHDSLCGVDTHFGDKLTNYNEDLIYIPDNEEEFRDEDLDIVAVYVIEYGFVLNELNYGIFKHMHKIWER